MRFRLLVLLTFSVAVIAGIKPYYAQDGLFDDTPQPAAGTDPADAFDDPEPADDAAAEDLFDGADAASDDLFDDAEPAARNTAAADIFDDSRPAAGGARADAFDDPEPATNVKRDDLSDETNPARAKADEDLLGGLDATEPQPRDLRLEAFRLHTVSADQATAILRELYSDRLHQERKVDCDRRNNVVLVRGPANWLKEVQIVLRALDSKAARGRDDGMTQPANQVRDRMTGALNAPPPPNSPGANDTQERIRALTEQYQSMTNRDSDVYDASGDQAHRVADEIRAAVQQAFNTRQQQQQWQIQQIQQRLAALQQRVQEREQKRQRIIEQAVNDLLSPGTPDSQTSRRRQRFLDALGSSGHGTIPRAILNQPQSPRRNPRKQTLDAEAEYQKSLGNFERAQQMMRKGYITENQLTPRPVDPYGHLPAEYLKQRKTEQLRQTEAVEQIYAKQLAERRAATIAADAEFETNIKRLELNLAEAEAELAYSKEEYEAAKTLHKGSATNVSQSRLRKAALQHRQASISVERARLELESAKRREK